METGESGLHGRHVVLLAAIRWWRGRGCVTALLQTIVGRRVKVHLKTSRMKDVDHLKLMDSGQPGQSGHRAAFPVVQVQLSDLEHAATSFQMNAVYLVQDKVKRDPHAVELVYVIVQ
uniref:Uncharacterized protein n=1 Tax=Arion vulgaris TaxID=1028688 RepID=A0A0B7A1I5_9EUPU